jgi:hypothetical protein
MSGRHRVTVMALILAAVLAFLLLVVFAASACPVDTASQPCPGAPRNIVLVIGLAATAAVLAVTPFAFLGEVLARNRIVYRGAWSRAVRRGILAGLVVAALAGLRLAGVLSVPIAIFIVTLAGAAEWLAARRDR